MDGRYHLETCGWKDNIKIYHTEMLGSVTSSNGLIKMDSFIKMTVMAFVAMGPGLYLRSADAAIGT
jgi:hypothetical protein